MIRPDPEYPELPLWICGIVNGLPHQSGDFLTKVAEAACHADDENYIVLRPALLRLQEKYPKYRCRHSPEDHR